MYPVYGIYYSIVTAAFGSNLCNKTIIMFIKLHFKISGVGGKEGGGTLLKY